MLLLLGISSIILGILFLTKPVVSLFAVALMFGIWLLVTGVVSIVQSFSSRFETGPRVLFAISGLLSIVLGVVCLKNRFDAVLLLVIFIGITWLFRGITHLAASNEIKDGKGWYVFLGVVEILAGIVLLVWPISSAATLMWVAGIWLPIIGIFEIIAAFKLRSIAKSAATA